MFESIILPLVILFPGCCYTERILFFNGFSSHSHLVAMEPLANKLADRGHLVTIVSPMTPSRKHPNITYFCPQAVINEQMALNVGGDKTVQARIASKYNDYAFQSGFLIDAYLEVCQKYYESQEFKDWIKNSKFHLVVLDALAKECGYPLVHLFKAKSIIFAPHTILSYDPDSFGWMADPAADVLIEDHPYLPDSFQNEKQNLLWYFAKLNIIIPRYEQMIKEVMQPEDMPSLLELDGKSALMFVNIHFSYETSRSLPPFVVPIGGIHCRESEGLEEGPIKTAIEDPRYENFIFVSFGSFAQVSAAPEDFVKKFITAFEKFPEIKFLWKWEQQVSKYTFPENVFIHKWFPQQDVLAHPKCKGFITHGGLLSFQQAIFHEVPIIVVPFYCDQPMNARLAQRRGIGIHLEPSEITVERLQDAIQQLVFTDKFSSKAKLLSRQFKDRPMSPVDTAVWWTEYVLRHDDLTSLKPEGHGKYWWERRMLHYWGLIFILLSLVVASTIWAISVVVCFIKKILTTCNGAEDRRKIMEERKNN